MTMTFKAYVFDAYGTLFDVHSAVSRHAELVGPNSDRVSEIWRNKQLEYTWTRSGMGRYLDFHELTDQALRFALSAVAGANKDAHTSLMEAYQTLDCYEEVPPVLAELKQRGFSTAILSNGSPGMLQSAIISAGLEDKLDEAFSVDAVKTFKTDPATYKMVTDHFGCEPGEIAFQSSNRWDIAGATAFGFHCHWVNRTGQPDEYDDLAPQTVLKDLNGLLD